MPRQRRTISKTSIYHIIMRGIDKQDIFYNDKDKEFILNQLSKVKKKFNLEIYAYCLMYNHIHLVFRVEKNLLSKSIQSLGIRYSQYFNKKYDRSGTFFESRFRSKTVEDKKYFLDVCRYVHRNPEKAGISTVEDWRWSSYNEYVTKEKIINKRVLLYYFDDDINKFIDFTVNQRRNLNQESREELEYEFKSRFTDEELGEIITKKILANDEIKDIVSIAKLSLGKQKELVEELSEIPGINMTQLARVTRINRRIVKETWKKDVKENK